MALSLAGLPSWYRLRFWHNRIARRLAGAGAAPLVYPLDLAGTLPAFAYSTKKLIAAYGGSAFRVVRPSDSATLDVGFVGQDWDTAAVDAFLSAQIGHVDKWYDQTGNGNDATQTTDASRPLIENGSVSGGPVLVNGKRPLIFNTSSMVIPTGVSISRAAVNTFSVLEPLGASGETAAIIQLGSGTSQFSLFQQLFGLQGNGVPTPSKPIEQRAALYEVIGNGTAGSSSQDFDATTGAVSAVTMAGGFVGNTSLSAGYDGKSYMTAVVGYGRVLSTGEGAALRAALRTMFGLVSVANSGRLVFVGDSIVAASTGTPYSYGFAKMVQHSLPSNTAVYNYGAGGTQIQTALGTYATTGAGFLLPKYSDSRVVFMLYGTNDLTIGGRTAAQIYADIQTYAGNVRTDGGKIIVCTLTPNGGWSAGQQTTWSDLNTLIRNGWASFADGLCDFANNVTMGSHSAAVNTSLYPDGLHPSRLGCTYLAADALAAIKALGIS